MPGQLKPVLVEPRHDKCFSDWIRKELPPSSTGFLVTDIDFVMYNYKTKKIMIIELKQYNKDIPFWQRNLYALLHKTFLKGLPKDVEYLGTHLITFRDKDFSDDVWFDEDIVSEAELIKKLSF